MNRHGIRGFAALLGTTGLLFVGVAGAVPQPSSLQESSAAAAATTSRAAYVPPIKHVFVINIENKGYDETWGPSPAAPYLAKTLRGKGVLLNTYYGTAHNSQPNYVAQISGQGPTHRCRVTARTTPSSSAPEPHRPGRP